MDEYTRNSFKNEFPITVSSQCLQIKDLNVEHLPCLMNGLRDAAALGYLCLTHFKITQLPHHVLRWQHTLDLVSALRGAPLEVLTISRLTCVGE